MRLHLSVQKAKWNTASIHKSLAIDESFILRSCVISNRTGQMRDFFRRSETPVDIHTWTCLVRFLCFQGAGCKASDPADRVSLLSILEPGAGCGWPG